MFSREFCEIFKNTFFYRTPTVAASDYLMNFGLLLVFLKQLLKRNTAFIPINIDAQIFFTDTEAVCFEFETKTTAIAKWN